MGQTMIVRNVNGFRNNLIKSVSFNLIKKLIVYRFKTD
jgi:hypothetical protein